MKILVVEDDPGLNRGISFALLQEGYETVTGDGIDLCRQIRSHSDTPILMLTARDMETDEIMGLKSGADDYITKPFSISILKLRLEKALKNHTSESDTNKNPANTQLCSGTVRLNVKTARAFLNETELELSLTEFRLLRYFLENKNQVLLKEQILQHIWDHDSNFVEENTLSVNISRLRRKIGNNHIKTIYGMGYLWEET